MEQTVSNNEAARPAVKLPPLESLGFTSALIKRLKALPVLPVLHQDDHEALKDVRIPLATAAIGATPSNEVPREVMAAYSSALPAAAAGNVADTVGAILAAAAAAAAKTELTLTRLYLLETAHSCSVNAGDPNQHLLAKWRLGELVANTGDIKSGTLLMSEAADGLFACRGATADPSRAWLIRYRLAETLYRSRFGSAEGERKLREIVEQAARGSEASFRARCELVAFNARPGGAGEAHVEASKLIEQINDSTLECRAGLVAQAQCALGYALSLGPSYDWRAQACKYLRSAVAAFEASNDWPNLSLALDSLGHTQAQLGEHEAAHETFERAIALKCRLKDIWGLGASLALSADSKIRRGKPLETIPFFQAGLQLLEHSISPIPRLVLQNMGSMVMALLAPYQNPLEAAHADPAHLLQASQTLQDYQQYMQDRPDMESSRAYFHMLSGSLRRIEARDPPESQRIAKYKEAQDLLKQSVVEFRNIHQGLGLPDAEIALAGTCIEHARLSGMAPDEKALLLESAKAALQSAEQDVWDSYERAYLNLEWAAYYRAIGDSDRADASVALAGHHARMCGNLSIIVDAQARLKARLRGPTGDPAAQIVLPPGTHTLMEFTAVDWLERPLMRYPLQVALEGPEEKSQVVVEPSAALETDPLGRAHIGIRAPAGSSGGMCYLRVFDQQRACQAEVQIFLQPLEIEISSKLAGNLELNEEERMVIRNLLGPRFGSVRIIRQFGGGMGGAKVLLAEPQLLMPEPAFFGEGQLVAAQRCILKIGARDHMREEAARYDRYVRDILSSNISEFAAHAVWGNIAGVRMSLAGGQDWGKAFDEADWLADASPLIAAQFLESVFAGDLGRCWYRNAVKTVEGQRLSEAYGPQVPVLLTLIDPGIGDGLLQQPPGDLAKTPLQEGLLPAQHRNAQIGNLVYLGLMQIVSYSRDEANRVWNYELRERDSGLRAALLTPVPPEHMDTAGVAANLMGAQRYVTGKIHSTVYEALYKALLACIEQFNSDSPSEKVVLLEGEQKLKIDTPLRSLKLPLPLASLHQLMEMRIRYRRSIIHGDLHTRNIIVGSMRLPYYIDFGKTGIGPTLFDFIKHEIYLWSWNFASWPLKTPPSQCTLENALLLMDALTQTRWPSQFAQPPAGLAELEWLPSLLGCIATLRSIAQNYSVEAHGHDYFAPLCAYSGLMLRWCNPARAPEQRRKSVARDGIIQTILSAMILSGNCLEGFENLKRQPLTQAADPGERA